MRKRLFSAFLAIILMCSLVPAMSITTHAGYEDGDYCWHCGKYAYDDWLCDCGAHSIDSDEGECFVDTHCNNCGECLMEHPSFCPECMYCENCMVGYHCPDCEECYFGSEGELCGDCFRCESCGGSICSDCGFCEDCIEADTVHCTYCDTCFSQIEPCASGGDHCVDCCMICDECGECQGDESDAEMCDECGLCVACCLDKAADEGCSCEEYCIEGSNWDSHFCSSCEECFDDVEQCETCGLCIDCCEDNSECSDGLCIESIDYEEHLCEECGSCFHDVEQCVTCDAAGLIRCTDCCKADVEAAGCDCDDGWCISDSDFDTHLEEEHSDMEKEHKGASVWSYDESGHWHNCIFGDEHFDEADHIYTDGICSVCGYVEGGGHADNTATTIQIKKQPKSVKCSVSVDAYELDSLDLWHNTVTYTVVANGPGTLQYQWQWKRYDSSISDYVWKDIEDTNEYEIISGSKTNTLETSVRRDACYNTYQYRCIISSSEESVEPVISRVATTRASHIYTYVGDVTGFDYQELSPVIRGEATAITVGGKTYYQRKSSGHSYECLGDGCERKTTFAHRYSELGAEYNKYSNWTRLSGTDSSGNCWKERTCLDCGYKQYARINKPTNKLVVFYAPIDADPVTLEIGRSLSEYSFSSEAAGISSVSVEWYEDGELVADPSSVQISEGKTYRLRITATAADGYVFFMNPEGEMLGEPLDEPGSSFDRIQMFGWSAMFDFPHDHVYDDDTDTDCNICGYERTVTPPEPITYTIISGNGQTVTKGNTANFVSDADFEKFERVEVDGSEVDAANYAVVAGSTDVTFTEDYIASLSDGSHTIAIVSDDGTANGSFLVAAAEDENDDPGNNGDSGNTDPGNDDDSGNTDPGNDDDSGNTDPGNNDDSGNTDSGTPDDSDDPVDSSDQGQTTTKNQETTATTVNVNKTGTTTVQNTSAKSAKTGDPSQMILWVSMLSISCMAGIAAINRRRKTQK